MAQASAIRDRPLTRDCRAACGSITVDEALRMVRDRARPVAGLETVALAAARGRILAGDVISPINVPSHDSAAMDGYAIQVADLATDGDTRLLIGGRAAAGHPLGSQAARGEAVRVFTGAPMPSGADTVVMQEDCIREGRFVRIGPGARPGANLRRAGDDVSVGVVALLSGQRLGPQHLALAAAISCRELQVRRRLRVAVFSSGDELRDPGDALGPGQVHDANRFAIIGALQEIGCEIADLGILGDDACVVQRALARAATDNDLVLTSGGMSDGEEDHVKASVYALGELAFWSLAVKPGRPVGMGRIGVTPFVGLPGNPVAAMVAFLVIGKPLALALAGARDVEPLSLSLRSGFRHAKRTGRREYLCTRLDRGGGETVVQKLPRQGSHLLSSLAAADGLAVLPEDRTLVEPGDAVGFLPLVC
jgi:molybdopterin molybdotransferase